MKNSLNKLGSLTAAATLAMSAENAESATTLTMADTLKKTSEVLGAPQIESAEIMSTTLLNMTGTGNSFGAFGLYDGLTFTADGVGSISQLNYSGMPSFSEGFIGLMDRNTGNIIPGSQVSFGPSGTLSSAFALNGNDLYVAMFKTTDPFALQTGALTINQAQVPGDGGFINPEAPISSVLGSDLVYRGQDQYGTLSINGSSIPEPSAAALAGLGAASLLTRRRRKDEKGGE